MADYSELKQNIASVIKSNNRREITGQILQNVLNQMVGSLGENYQLAGFAEPTTNPQQPDQTLFYIAEQAGVYTNFDNITLGDGLSFLMWKNSEWTSHTIGVATHSWVDSNYVSKAFLRQIFRVYDADGFEILPNDTTSIADNIKAMVGLWTNEYLSALGLGDDGQTGARYLTQLGDVNIDNETLANGQVLVYDNGLWVNGQAGGVDMSVVWAALAGNTNEQINASHLTTALTGYVTSSSLSTTLADYVTTTALNTALASYATQSWVSQNYVSIAFLNRILRAYDSTDTQVQPNDTTTAIDNLKAMVGLWTEQYLSALGQGNDGGGGGYITTLGQLEDVLLTTPSVGQALVYAEVESGVYKWVNGTAGVDMSSVWTALAGGTNEQIALSHLTTALSGYVTTGGLSTTLADYVTATALSTTLADYVTATSLSTTLASYATQQWVGQNYVSIAFFNRLFAAYDSSNVIINPNDTTTAVDNIKALVGLWTQQYLSALGQGSDGGVVTSLANLTDVDLGSTISNNDVLTYDSSTNKWTNKPAQGGSTVAALGDLTDVGISSLADKDILQYDYTNNVWKNVTLATALTGYATQSWVQQQGYITSSALSGYATQAWVGQQGFALTSQIPTNNNQLTNGAGYITSSELSGCVKYAGNQTSIGSSSPVNNAQAWVTTTNLPNGNALVYNSAGSEFSMLFSFNPSNLGWGTILRWGYIDKYLYITRRQVGNDWLDGSTDWAKISAGYADSAGDADTLDGQHGSYYAPSVSGGYLPRSAGSSQYLTGDLYINAYDRFTTTSGTSPQQHDFTALTTAASVALFLEQPSNDEGAFIINGDTAIIYNAFDTGWGFQVHDEDLANGQSNVFNDNTRAFGVNSDYKVWARGGFAKYGSDDNYVLLGGGGHAAISGLSVSYAATAGTANDPYKLPLAGGKMTGMIDTTYDTPCMQFRDGNTYLSRLQYMTYGNEALVFANANSVTSYMFFTGVSLSSSSNLWNVLGTPALQIKQNCVSINHLIDSGVTPDAHLYVGGSIYAQSTITSAGRIQANGAVIFGYMYNASNNAAAFALDKPGSYNTGIGAHAQSDTIWFGACYGSDGSWVDSYTQIWKFNGDIVANGGVTALSDERDKIVVGEPTITVEQIAQMPTVLYRWNDGREDKSIHAGTLAQRWEGYLSEVVLKGNDERQTRSFDYGVAALIAATIDARKIVDHDRLLREQAAKISELENKCSFLEREVERLKCA